MCVLNHRYSKYCLLITVVAVVVVVVAAAVVVVVTMMTDESIQLALQCKGISQHLRISVANHWQL